MVPSVKSSSCRVTVGLFAALGVTHGLAPLPLGHVIDEDITRRVGWYGQEQPRVWHVAEGHITISFGLLRDSSLCGAQNGYEKKQFSCHDVYYRFCRV